MNKNCIFFRGIWVAPNSTLYEALQSKDRKKIEQAWKDLNDREREFARKYGLEEQK